MFFSCACVHKFDVVFRGCGGFKACVGQSADSTAQQRMRPDDKTPQRPQATVVGDDRGKKGEKGG